MSKRNWADCFTSSDEDEDEDAISEYCYAGTDLDFDTKLAALKAYPSIVSLVSYTGEEEEEEVLFTCSGTIIECEERNGTSFGTILTSATLIRGPSGDAAVASDIRVDVYLFDGKLFEGRVSMFDFHFNVAIIEIKSDTRLPTAVIRCFSDSILINARRGPNAHVDKAVDSILINPNVRRGPRDSSTFQLRCHVDKAVDSILINPNVRHGPRDSSTFQLRRHVDKAVDSHLFKIRPGDRVVALGRHHRSNNLMAESGEFSVDCCNYDCQELFMASCRIYKNAIGGPLINRYGEVIGINFYHMDYTPFLPINIVSKCLEDFKKHGRVRSPWLGVEVSNFYVKSVDKLEIIVNKFPNINKGVVVEKVVSKSPADCAGIHPDDVIVQCNGHDVGCFLEFFIIMWDKVGESVKVVMVRPSSGAYVNLTMVVDEICPENYYKWIVPKK